MPAFTQTAGEYILSLRNFNGLNTIAGDFAIKSTESRTAHNIDWGRNLGSITKRLGYDSVSALSTAFDSIVGVYGAYQSDGQQYLACALDSLSVGYGGLYSTPYGSKNIHDSLTNFWPQWSIQFPTSFAMFQDRLYAVNGAQKGVVYDKSNKIARSFPLNSPGEPKIVPIAGGAAPYTLNGEYRYLFTIAHWVGPTMFPGYAGVGASVVSTPIVVSNGRAFLSEFTFYNKDAVDTGLFTTSVLVYRTKKNPGRLDDLDMFYRVGHGDSLTLKGTAFGGLSFIDSIPDDSLSTTDTTSVLGMNSRRGIDSLSTLLGRRYGSPGYVSRTTDTSAGINKGMPKQKDTLGVVYVCTFMDTVLATQSDTGRSLFVYEDTVNHQSMKTVTITIPKIPYGGVGVKINLYRAHILELGRDSTWYDSSGTGIAQITKIIKGKQAHDWLVDTVVVDRFHLLKQLSITDTIFTDSIPYDSLVNLRTLPVRALRQPLSRIFPHRGYMFGTAGSTLYYSKLDSGASWGEFQSISINEDDGDQITDAWATRTAIVVKKNKSSWNVYQNSDGKWSLSEVSNYIGDIAPYSHAAGPSGHFYLSDYGVFVESDGQYLERSFSNSLVSAPLKNFDLLPITVKSKARGYYWHNNYLLNIGDTTYVFNDKAQAWSTWSLPIGGATMYGTEHTGAFLPGDTLYFFNPGGKTLYRYGTSELDNGASFPLVWESAPLAISQKKKQLTGFGLWSQYSPADPNDTLLTGYIYNESSFLGLGALSTDIRERYRIQSLRDLNEGLYFRFKIQKNFGSACVIDGIDVFYTEGGFPERK